MRAFERGLTQPAGFVLPVQRWTAQAKPGWLSEMWRTRRGRLFLVPGDSPVGLRLPLQSLPYVAPVDYPHLVPADPFADARPAARSAHAMPSALAANRAARTRRRRSRREAAVAAIRAARRRRRRAAPSPVRTALTVEPRDGRLCVFMPPVERLEDYLELLAAVEATAAELGTAGADRRLSAAARSAPQRHQGDARPRRDRGQHPSGRRAGARRSTITRSLYEDAHAVPARRRQVHDRRPPHRHRRRQSRRARRRSTPPTARSCAGPIC